MCHTYTFYNTCGHVHKRTLIFCLPTIQHRITQHVAGTEEQHVCSDRVQESKIYPTMCETCSKIEEMSEWMRRTSEERLEMVRTFNHSPAAFIDSGRPSTPMPKELRAMLRARISSPALTDGASAISESRSNSLSSFATHENWSGNLLMTKSGKDQSQRASPIWEDISETD